ncbi:MAG: gamma-glutamylcyclotransferase [Propionicimonas sp.]|nr:gamma-glutamylcyclotransferase [Propionicimonas sp.]
MTVLMFVNGQAMTGGSLNTALQGDGARFVAATETADKYRFVSVRDEFPGLYPAEGRGWSVPGELYEVSYEVLRDVMLPREPAELELGVIELKDGSGSLCMHLRAEFLASPQVSDISDRGGWKKYLASLEEQE